MTLAFSPRSTSASPDSSKTPTVSTAPRSPIFRAFCSSSTTCCTAGTSADDLPSIDVPALVLCGDRDPVVAPEDTAELAELIPRAELVRIPGAAHSVLAEGGESILEQVIAFLAGGTTESPRSYKMTPACSAHQS